MPRKVKCPVCGTFNNKEETIFHSQRYYCPICFENKEKESEDYKTLCEYICDLYNLEVLNGWIFKQIKDFKEQFNYTYIGMKTTLDYFYRIKQGEEPEEGMGIGIIPFVYDEAKKFYIDKKAIKDSVINCDVDELRENRKIIHVKEKNKTINEKYKDIVTIDISQL